MSNYISRIRSKVGHEPIFFNVACALIIKDGKVLLQKRSDALDEWAIPGGGLEIGEDAETCLRREIFEEMGLEINIEKFQGVYISNNMHTFPNGDICHIISYIFICTVNSEKIIPDKKEILGAKYFNLSNLPLLFRPQQSLKIFEDFKADLTGVIR